MKHNIPFGYEMRDGKLVPREIESAIVQYRYEKGIEYSENPPEELVREIIEECELDGETITYEEAKERVTQSRIAHLIWSEIREKWEDYFENQSERANLYIGRLGEKKHQETESKPIVSREVWEQAQAAMADQGDDEPTDNSPTMKL